MTVAQTTKYVIKYKLNGERRFEFAQLENGTEAEAKAALDVIHARLKTSSATSASARRCNGIRSVHLEFDRKRRSVRAGSAP